MWWVVRLLIIIVNGLKESALWTTIPPYIPDNNTKLTTKFIKNLIFSKNPIVELFVVQRKALNKVLSSKGAVISLPTSSGKTRIAELAILKCLSENPYAKILYLAPFSFFVLRSRREFKQYI
jgi:replicative superfamily II helicase